MKKEPSVPAKYARLLLKIAREHGHDINPVVSLLDLPFNPMALSDSELPEQELSVLDFSKLYNHVAMLLQDESFGTGRIRLPMGTFRMFCYAIIHSPSLKIALDRSIDFYAILYEAKGLDFNKDRRYRVSDGGEFATLMYSGLKVESDDSMNLQNQLSIINYLSLQHRFCSWLIGAYIPVHEVNVMGSEILSNSGYRSYFDCPINFNQKEYSFTIKAHFLDTPLVHTEESLHNFLTTAPYGLFAIVNEDESIIKKIRSLIGNNFTRKIPGFDEVAEKLNISSRTLRRRLEKEGTSYQRVKDDCRRDAAIDYLTRSGMSINAVAHQMGFDEPSAFHRSFKKWTDITPGEFRKRNAISDVYSEQDEVV